MTLLQVQDLHVDHPTPAGVLRAVRGVGFTLQRGETLGLVGESGCGKSSLGRALLRLAPVTAGRVMLDGHELTAIAPRRLRQVRPLVQMVFQDNNASLNPRHRVGTLVAQPLRVHGVPRREAEGRALDLLRQVGLAPSAAERYPHEFSGGQRQRIGIARALALQPRLLVCDEPVSALDVSVRAQIINLLQDLQAELGLSMLFISHDLSVVRHLCNRVLVMYLGRIVESGPTEFVWRSPAHPYTRALLAAAPRRRRAADPADVGADAADAAIELPNPLAPPPGCAFAGRCPYATARCQSEQPLLRALANGREVACHLDLLLAGRAPLTSTASRERPHAGSSQLG